MRQFDRRESHVCRSRRCNNSLLHLRNEKGRYVATPSVPSEYSEFYVLCLVCCVAVGKPLSLPCLLIWARYITLWSSFDTVALCVERCLSTLLPSILFTRI